MREPLENCCDASATEILTHDVVQMLVRHRLFQALIDRLDVGLLPCRRPSDKKVEKLEIRKQITSVKQEVVRGSWVQARSEDLWLGYGSSPPKSLFSLGAVSEGYSHGECKLRVVLHGLSPLSFDL
jgi:hypothetical protein